MAQGGWGQPPGGGGGWGQPPGGPPGGGGGWGAPPPGPSPGPYQPPGQYPAPPPGMPPGYQAGGSPAMAGGVPWESTSGGFLGRWWETVAAGNFKGRQFYAAVAQSEDPMPPCLFSMTTGAITMFVFTAVFMIIYALFLAAIIGSIGSLGGKGSGPAAMMLGFGIAGIIISVVIYTVMGAVMGFIGPWIGGGLSHLGLMVLGGVGPGKGYSHTVRATGYAYASAQAWLMLPIPVLNYLIVLVFSIINHINAFDEMHQCGGGKAFVAFIWPLALFICCCCGFGIIGNL